MWTQSQYQQAAAGSAAPSGRVLLVEDNEIVRALTLRALEEAGHTVVQAADGREALEALSQEAPFDLLVVDVVLPGMDGFAIAERALAVSPGLRILFTSGYGPPEALPDGATAVGFLQKPFHVPVLTSTVADLLAATG
jgi:CheY-like chemotaxis protein